MDARTLLPLLALPLLLRRTDRDSPRQKRAEPPPKPPILVLDLPPTFRKFSPRTSSLDAIVLHCTEGGPDARKSAEHALIPVEQGGRRASFHHVVGRDGTIVQVVPWERQAWHCTSLPGLMEISWNQRSIGIEICALPHQGMTPRQERALVRLLRYLVWKFSIPVENITAHRFTGANTSCPDSLWRTEDELARWKRKHFANG